MRPLLLLPVLICACTPGPASAPARGRGREEIVPGRVLVELWQRPAAFPQAEEAAQPPALVLGGVPVRVRRYVFDGSDGEPPVLLGVTAAADEEATRRDLLRIGKDPRVRRAEPDRIRRPASLSPNDPHFAEQWGLLQIKMPDAWQKSQGSEKVTVAVLDTGILKGHPDLSARLLAGYDFVSDLDNSGDGDGWDPDPTDPGNTLPGSSGLHGVHVTGIIGAQGNNKIGIAGIDWKCGLLPVRVLGIKEGTGTDSDIASAMVWATGGHVKGVPDAAAGADVVNMSFGGLGISFTLQHAVDHAIARGSIVVAAAGNLGDDAAVYSPSGLDGIITVGASDEDAARASYSNYGPRVDLLAPGGGGDDISECSPNGILSTYRDLGPRESGNFSYCTLKGTSQAAPHVSAAVALVKALAPRARQNTVAALLRTSADHRKMCDGTEFGGCGAGLLDVDTLLTYAGQQASCGCKGDKVCFNERCIDPGYPHVSIFADPVVRGGCQAAAGAGAGGPLCACLFGLGAACARRQRRERRGR